MKVLHSCSLDVKAGGPTKSTYLTIKGLLKLGVDVEDLTFPLLPGGKLINDDIKINFTKPLKNIRFAYMPDLGKTLDNIKDVDLYHVQGLWQYMGHKVASYARKHNKPYMFTLRGMLYPVGINQSKYIKKAAMLLYQRKDLQMASCIQVTCMDELNYYRDLGFTNPAAIIANPIEVCDIVDQPIPQKEKVVFGYLGRLHALKRVERLIYAFASSEDFKDAELHIIGAQDAEYENFLKSEVERLNLNNVKFLGFLSGKAKDKALDQLSYLVAPADQENFGNIMPEALVRGIPCIVSKGMPWQELEEFNCGWWISNDQGTINKTMLEALHVSREQNIIMGMNGKKLIKERYSVEYLGVKMKKVYDWILNDGEKPDFVYL